MGLNCLYSLAGVGGGQGEGTQCNYLGSVLAWSLAQSTTVEFYSEECGQQTCNQCSTMLYNTWSLTGGAC